MEDFTISNHPILTDITRKAELTKMSVDMGIKELTLYLKIKHYLNDIYIPELDKAIISVGTNETQYPTGEPAPEPTEENPNPTAPTIGEFDYWDYLYSLNTPLSVMLTQGIGHMDLVGILNLRCNYGS